MARGVSTSITPSGVITSTPYATTSGVVPASGTLSTTLSGPWMEERQNLTVDYVRVPWGSFSSTEPTLNSCTTVYGLKSTKLQAHVVAHYSRKKTYNNYSVSSWTQTQQFKITASSAEAQGINYGDPVSANATLGPAGTINTVRQWINRRPWQSTDTEVSKECD